MRIRVTLPDSNLLDVALVVTGAVFITLKLTGQIDWSWWLVLLPLYGLVLLQMAAIVLLGTMGGLAALLAFPLMRGEDRRNAKRKDEWEARDARYAAEQAQIKEQDSSAQA